MNFFDFLEYKLTQLLLFILDDRCKCKQLKEYCATWSSYEGACLVHLSGVDPLKYRACYENETKFLTTYWLLSMEIERNG